MFLLVVAAPASAAAPLRLNDLQARGTHNSYHRTAGYPGAEAPGWDYSHAPLDVQFEEQGVRQIELDLHYNAARREFEVYHAWLGDDRTTCDPLAECLAQIKAWSDAHRAHHPILVLIEPKDAGPPKNTELPEDGDPFTLPFTEAEYARLDAQLIEALGADRVLTPGDVTRRGLSLRESIARFGWPRLDAVRGQVLFLVDGDDHAAPYSRGWTSLAGRSMFVQAEADSPVAAFVGRDGARLAGEDKYARMARLVAAGFMVRDLTSPGEFAAAKAAGAQFLSTDEPSELELSGDPAAPSRCNPVTAPASCTARAIETHLGGDWESSAEPSDAMDQVLVDKVDRVGCGTVRSTATLATGTDPGCL
jgi:hypothetical protein